MTEANTDLLRQRLRRLSSYLPHFEADGFQFGRWTSSDASRPGEFVMPTFEFSAVASEFIHAAYDAQWVQKNFDWSKWMAEPEATSLRDDPAVLARATPDQIARLLTVLIRQERFCEGSLASAHKSGLPGGILRRAAALESELSTEK